MRLTVTTITTILTLLTSILYGQDKKILKGITIDGHRNRILAVNVIVKGTTTGTITDACGEFSIPIEEDSFTLTFHGMTYDDMRTYEIELNRNDIKDDLILFQLGHWKIKNDACKKAVDKKSKHYKIE